MQELTDGELPVPDVIYIIPPGYNEYGAEVSFEGLHWLSLNAGTITRHRGADAAATGLAAEAASWAGGGVDIVPGGARRARTFRAVCD